MARGKYRGGHPTGKRHFSRDLGQDEEARKKKEGEESSSDESDDSSDEGVGGVGGGRAPVGDDDEDDKPKAASATEGMIETANPNAPRKAAVKTADADLDAPQELSRREREVLEKARAEERHWKLTQQGKTTEAQADLARLSLIKTQREEAAKKRAEEEAAKKAALEAKKAGGAAAGKK